MLDKWSSQKLDYPTFFTFFIVVVVSIQEIF
jgi:hypothetical protein